ncbi:MAG: sigma-70 family RNA polymerase sigma factor [Candidatus Aminicenantes bacterium]|nr:sigma-70 family RNA polymerase sigma factor [Candidatus Aminicenantes bacterium]
MKQSELEAVERKKEAFWGFLAAREKKLFNFLRKALNFSEDSADLFQEVVLRAWKYFPSYDRQRDFSVWIFAIAHNEIKKYFTQSRKERAVIPLAQLVQEPAAPAADPDIALIHDAAQRLPARQREIFFLFYYNRFSVAEVAAICGLRQGNVKFILNRGREAVRCALEVKNEK